jgi:hypothetical protein
MFEFITEPKVRKSKDVKQIAAALEEPGVYILFKGRSPLRRKGDEPAEKLLTHMRIGSRYGNVGTTPDCSSSLSSSPECRESIVIASIGGAANSATPRIKKDPYGR